MARLLALVVLLAASPCRAQGTPVPEAAVDSLMAVYGADGPGGVVAVVRSGEVVFAKGYGLADVEHGVPNTPATPYHLASISKQFTAFAVALLADQGRLSLDDDVRDHVPEVPDFGATITLRHLATHTSGLRDQWALWAMSGGRLDDVIRQGDLLRLVARQRALNFEPGTEHLYSNTGYMLLAEVVARVTGEPFGAWMAANVFGPLGMEATQILDDHERIVPGRAASYYLGEDGLRVAALHLANSGATSMVSTAEDLARWLGNLGTHAVGGPAVARMMRERGTLASGDSLDYALGVTLDEHRGVRRVQHPGSDAGFRTFIGYYPDLDAGVVALGNVASFDRQGVADGLAELFFGDEMDARKPSGGVDDAEVVIPTARLDAFAGRYQIPGGPVLTIARVGDALTIQAPGQPQAPLAPVGDALFRIDDPGFEVRVGFTVAADGSVSGATLHQGGELPLQRIRWDPDPATLASYAGRYVSPELETAYVARVMDDRLVLSHIRHGDIGLAPTAEDVFQGDSWFMGEIAFDRGPDGAVREMRVSNGRVRALLFQKQE